MRIHVPQYFARKYTSTRNTILVHLFTVFIGVFFSTVYTYSVLCSGVGTVAAVAALAATLFRPQINIHNLLKLLYK